MIRRVLYEADIYHGFSFYFICISNIKRIGRQTKRRKRTIHYHSFTYIDIRFSQINEFTHKRIEFSDVNQIKMKKREMFYVSLAVHKLSNKPKITEIGLVFMIHEH